MYIHIYIYICYPVSGTNLFDLLCFAECKNVSSRLQWVLLRDGACNCVSPTVNYVEENATSSTNRAEADVDETLAYVSYMHVCSRSSVLTWLRRRERMLNFRCPKLFRGTESLNPMARMKSRIAHVQRSPVSSQRSGPRFPYSCWAARVLEARSQPWMLIHGNSLLHEETGLIIDLGPGLHPEWLPAARHTVLTTLT